MRIKPRQWAVDPAKLSPAFRALWEHGLVAAIPIWEGGGGPYAIGPKLEQNAPKGGISMLLLSAEYVRPLTSRLDSFLFFDAGQVSDKQWDPITINRTDNRSMRFSTGFGARMKILEGGPPLCVGMGFPINSKSRSDVKKFFLSLGTKF